MGYRLMNNIGDNLVPLKSGLYPKEGEIVQVTYLEFYTHKRRCDQFAYLMNDGWIWALDDSSVNVEIVAWKKNCNPYDGDIAHKEGKIKEFRVVNGNFNCIEEYDSVVKACKEAVKNNYSVHVMDLKTKRVKEVLSDKVLKFMSSK